MRVLLTYSGIFVLFFLVSCGAKKKTVYKSPSSEKPILTSKEQRNFKNNYAEILGVKKVELNESLYQYIDEWIGTPHRLGGLNKDGIDCSGFVGNLYRVIYKRDLPRSSSAMAENVTRKYDDQLKEGDLVFFSFGGKNIDHVGVYLHNYYFVHVSTKKGVMISNLKEPWFYKYFTRCGTPKI